jgi:hypothetical protein
VGGGGVCGFLKSNAKRESVASLTKKKLGMCRLMTLKKVLLTMHDDEVGYEIFANIFEESNFVVVFQAGQRTCLVGFTFCLLNKVTRSNDKQTIV